MLRILGVHHRHQKSIAEVEDAIAEFQPNAVGVELSKGDYLRFLEATSYLETEMKIAMVTACEFGARVFLIDMEKEDITKELKRVIPVDDKELWLKFLEGDLPGFYRDLGRIDRKLVKKAQQVIIEIRDAFMASRAAWLNKNFERAMIVVGMSHIPGIQRRLPTAIPEKPIEVPCEEVEIYY